MVFSVMLTFPVQLMAATSTSSTTYPIKTFEFVSSDDYNLLVGESSTINFRLYDSTHSLYSGPITAYLWNTATGEIINLSVGGSGTFSANNVIVNDPGNYGLYVSDIDGNKMRGPEDVVVRNAVATATGNLSINISNTVSVKLTDSDGKALNDKSVTVDGTGVGLSTQSYTTLSDGTFNFVMTPTEIGTVKFIFGGHVVGTIAVSDMNVDITVSGSLILNAPSHLTGKLVDVDGNPMGNKAVQVDATNIGLNSSSYNTLNDGTFNFSLTPSQMGQVNLIFGGRVINTVTVQPAYSQGQRIGGSTSDNSSLSLAVAQKGWTSAENVIITRDDIVADSMVAVPLSKKLDAPILMTPSNEISPTMLAEINSLGAKHVYIIGGTSAVTVNVEDVLRQAGLAITRFAGADRYDTAAQVASMIGNSSTVYLAYGYGEPDALAASAFAAEKGIPILLTQTNVLPAVTKQAIENCGASTISILGGTGIISTGLENSLKQQYEVSRYGGADRYATEAAIFQNLFNTQSPQSPLYFTSALVAPSDVSTGKPYGDALIVAALAAKNNGFVITLPSNNLPPVLNYFLLYNKGYISTSTVVGNQGAISDSLESQLNTLLNH